MKEYIIQWGGGLGDIFNNLYKSGQYAALAFLHPDVKVSVLLFCHSPGAVEIFKYHPKRNQLDVKNFGFQKQEDLIRTLKEHDAFKIPRLRGTHGPVHWYPFPEDKEYIDLLKDKRYVIFSTTSSDPVRDIPRAVVDKLIKHFIKLGYYIVPIGKNYISVDGHKSLRKEQEFPKHEKIINLIDKVSVPGTAVLVKNAVGTITCHSSTNLLAWNLRKPNILLYDSVSETRYDFIGKGTQWTFGKDFLTTYHLCFDNFDTGWKDIKQHIKTHFK